MSTTPTAEDRIAALKAKRASAPGTAGATNAKSVSHKHQLVSHVATPPEVPAE